MTLEPIAQAAREKIAEAARGMLSGSLSFIEGACLIAQVQWGAKLAERDPDILPFVGIASETDTLPIGAIRQRWSPEALAKLQPEIDRAEKWASEFGRAKCQWLIDRFGAVPK